MKTFPAHAAYRGSSQDFYGGTGVPTKSPALKALPVKPNIFPVQFRNVDVGMFSGPRPSYGRYSASPAASDVATHLDRGIGR
jgi:hypothetical protein